MTQMQNFMLSVCFGATLGLIIGLWGFTIKCWLDDRKKKKTGERTMSLIDVFLAIFIGTLLFDFVAKTVVSLYMDIKVQLRKK